MRDGPGGVAGGRFCAECFSQVGRDPSLSLSFRPPPIRPADILCMQVKNDGQRLDEELGEVRQELEKQAGFIRSAFTYYSSANGALSKYFYVTKSMS